MADPFTLVAVGAIVAGTAMTIAAQQQAAAAQQNIVQHNAEQARQDAEAAAMLREREADAAEQQIRTERQATALETRLFREREAFRQGAEHVEVLGSGFEFEGSPLAVATRRAREAELEIELNQFASRQRQAQLTDVATMQRFEAAEFRRRGREALAVGGFRSNVIQQTALTQSIATGIGGAAQGARILRPR